MLDKMRDAASACFGGPSPQAAAKGPLQRSQSSPPTPTTDTSAGSSRSSLDDFHRLQSADSFTSPMRTFLGRSGKVYVVVDTSRAVPEPPLRPRPLAEGHLSIIAKHIRHAKMPACRKD